MFGPVLVGEHAGNNIWTERLYKHFDLSRLYKQLLDAKDMEPKLIFCEITKNNHWFLSVLVENVFYFNNTEI